MKIELRRRENPRALAGVDVDAAVAWMLKLPVFNELIPKRKNGRKLQVDVGHRSRTYSGRAWPSRFKIRVAAGPDATPAQVLVVCLHELTHIATPRCHHNERFRRVLQRALREAWELAVPIDPPLGNSKLLAYAMDQLAMAALDTAIKLGEADTFPAKAVERKPRVTTRALVEKRAAHAATMLARAERKLKLAKTIRQRWATKVAYYERAAAKRGES